MDGQVHIVTRLLPEMTLEERIQAAIKRVNGIIDLKVEGMGYLLAKRYNFLLIKNRVVPPNNSPINTLNDLLRRIEKTTGVWERELIYGNSGQIRHIITGIRMRIDPLYKWSTILIYETMQEVHNHLNNYLRHARRPYPLNIQWWSPYPIVQARINFALNMCCNPLSYYS